MKKLDYVKIIKIAAGTGFAIVAAESLGLRYSASAGVITLLSIQDTKRETLRVVARRLITFCLALLFSSASFRLFGYGAPAVCMFLLFFSAACMLLQMTEGISVNTVLMLHFLAEQSMTPRDIVNELALLSVGAGIGIVLNLYIPGKERQIKDQQNRIELLMKDILGNMAERLSKDSGRNNAGTQTAEETDGRASLEKLESELISGEKSAWEDRENRLLGETRYYMRYMNMRKMQTSILCRIEENIRRVKELPPQADQVSGLMKKIGAGFHEYNNAVELLKESDQVRQSMRGQSLPTEREEFESRAVLFLILVELEQFLLVKKEFVENMTEDEIHKFWRLEGR